MAQEQKESIDSIHEQFKKLGFRFRTGVKCNIELKKFEVTLVIVSCTAFFQISVCCNSPVTISALHVSYQYKNGKCEHLSAMNINSEPYQHQITVRGLPRGYENIRELFRKEKRF